MSPLASSQAVYRRGLSATGSDQKRRYPRDTVDSVLAMAHKGMNARTADAYLGDLRSFWAWLCEKHGASGNPLKRARVAVEDDDVRHNRRALSAEELSQLVAAARASDKVYRCLTDPDRATLYLTALWSGLRARAVGGLTPEMFRLSADAPAIIVPARLKKGNKHHTVPLSPKRSRS
ncbi:MAG TPA: hypothetical protein VM597_12980 [Gemmataceae bacterium]|jgi:integrase|nr:hypothetical protein [Gemmataceae bacterium]